MKPEHETRRKIIREWMSLPKDKQSRPAVSVSCAAWPANSPSDAISAWRISCSVSGFISAPCPLMIPAKICG
jgi:hypothetical protein